MNMEQALSLSRLLRYGGSGALNAAEARLAAKCRHEQMSRTAVLMNWGDPRDWFAATTKQEDGGAGGEVK